MAWISSNKSTAIKFIRKWKTFYFHSVEQERQWVLLKEQWNKLVLFILENWQDQGLQNLQMSWGHQAKLGWKAQNNTALHMRWKAVETLPGNRRARSSQGLHREVGPVPGKEFCWGLPPHVACEVPELKITVGPNPTLHQEQLTALLETGLYRNWVFIMAHNGLSCLLSVSAKGHYLHV